MGIETGGGFDARSLGNEFALVILEIGAMKKVIKVLLCVAFLCGTVALSGCTSESAPAPAATSGGDGASSDSKPASSDEKGTEEGGEAASDDKGSH